VRTCTGLWWSTAARSAAGRCGPYPGKVVCSGRCRAELSRRRREAELLERLDEILLSLRGVLAEDPP